MNPVKALFNTVSTACFGAALLACLLLVCGYANIYSLPEDVEGALIGSFAGTMLFGLFFFYHGKAEIESKA